MARTSRPHQTRTPVLARLRCSVRVRLGLAGPKVPALECYPRPFFFVHINKTGGSSVEQALGAPFLHMTAATAREQLGTADWERRFTFTVVRNPWAKVASHYRYRVDRGQSSLRDHPIAFPEWVRRAYGDRDPAYYNKPLMFADQTTWLEGDDGELLVDFVGRFEQIGDDFAEICRRLDRDTPALPHLRASSNAGRSYHDLYDDGAREVVAERFARDIARWDYSYA